MAPDTLHFDPASQEYNADPFPLFERARREQPIFFAEEFGCWVITRFDDITRVLMDFETFNNSTLADAPVPEAFQDRVPAGFFAKSFNALDPPEHSPVRKLGQGGFTRGRMNAMEGTIKEMADDLIDGFVGDGSADLISQFSHDLAQRTIGRLLDFPEEQIPRLKQLAEDLPRVFTDHLTPMPPAERDERWERVAALRQDFKELIRERRANPGDDFVSMLVSAKTDDGEPFLNDERVATHMTEMVFAGTDTTANLITSMVLLLDASPEARAAVQRDPSLMEQAVEEGLRRRGTVNGVFRYCTRDAEVGGVTIPAGSRVYAALASGSQDEAQFPSPQTFELGRGNSSSHLAFGKGRHLCMGAPLARVEAVAGLQTLYARIPELRVRPGQELRYEPVILSVMLKSLWVEW